MKSTRDIDRDALDRALAIALRMPGRAAQLKGRPKRAAGEFAAWLCQGQALGLRPWELPPCVADLDETPHGRLLRRLLDAGLSQWEPDPVAALDSAGAATLS